MKRQGTYYKKITIPGRDGQARTRFQCTYCLADYSDVSKATHCHWRFKPVVLALVQAAEVAGGGQLARLSRRKRPQAKGEKIEYPDTYGHWYRGRQRLKRLKVIYHKAWRSIEAFRRVQDIERLEKLYPTPEKPPRTPLQRMAYGYITGCWDAVRKAALDIEAETDKQAEARARRRDL